MLHTVCVWERVFARARVHLKEPCWSDSCTETPFPIKWGEINVPSHFISCVTFSLMIATLRVLFGS